MIKHIILWTLDEKFSGEEKTEIMANAKRELEGLLGKVPGLTEITLQTEKFSSSNADMMLNSTLENEAALKGYQVHPEHVRVANNFVRPFTSQRLCIDFEI